MSFSTSVKKETLVKSKRCCCICNEFCGRSCVIHHIKPESQGGSNKIANAIVLCQRCHTEVGHYNPDHPIGNKYSPEEIIKHRDKWWVWCENNPYKTPPKYPISISPNEINLGTGEWNVNTKFNLHNKSSEVYYQIVTKLIFLPPGLNPRYNIEILSERENYESKSKGIYINWDLFTLYSKDIKNRNAIFMFLSSLNPRDTCTFLIKIDFKNTRLIRGEKKVMLKVCGFSEEPARILNKDGKVAFPFSIPEC